MIIHTARNFLSFSPAFQSKQLLATYAAAKGAVIAEVMPAAKRPIPIKYPAALPYKGSKPFAKSITFAILPPGIAAAATMTDMETSPPRTIATTVSLRAEGKSDSDFHFSLTKAACKKRLYGTTVVPTRAMTVKIL